MNSDDHARSVHAKLFAECREENDALRAELYDARAAADQQYEYRNEDTHELEALRLENARLREANQLSIKAIRAYTEACIDYSKRNTALAEENDRLRDENALLRAALALIVERGDYYTGNAGIAERALAAVVADTEATNG